MLGYHAVSESPLSFVLSVDQPSLANSKILSWSLEKRAAAWSLGKRDAAWSLEKRDDSWSLGAKKTGGITPSRPSDWSM